ncbi:MAG: threonine--tRNA ligase, partial [Patescibacteria group bacterium]
KGYAIRKKLEDYIYEIEKQNGYLHVLTPQIAKEELYKKSGHLAHYKDDMYAPIEIDNEKYYLRPMNCPHHHSIYKHGKRSYRELPLRIAEFGIVYRHERSGVLSGLIRVRGFTQNDAHIYATEENLEKEIISILNLHKKVFDDFNIKDYWYRLSLPDFKNKEKFGDVKNRKTWEIGAAILKKSLKNLGHKFTEAVGEASFYGPKIDIQMKDLYGKEDTIATIQIDYYSAAKFNLSYIDKDGKEKPAIVIHRAIFGSFDRFFAFLIEKTCGNLPLWLAPLQVKILAVSEKHNDYAKIILEELIKNNIDAELAASDETLGKRIRETEMQKIPYILIVGDKEIQNQTVNVRHRDQTEEIKINELIEKIKKEIKNKTI